MKYRIRKYSPIWWAREIIAHVFFGAMCLLLIYEMASTYVKYGGF